MTESGSNPNSVTIKQKIFKQNLVMMEIEVMLYDKDASAEQLLKLAKDYIQEEQQNVIGGKMKSDLQNPLVRI